MFSDEFEKALADANDRRNIKPAIYNAKRLTEQPVPQISVAVNADNTDNADNEHHAIDHNTILSEPEIDFSDEVAGLDNTQNDSQPTIDPLQMSFTDISVKTEMDTINLLGSNNEAIDTLILDADDDLVTVEDVVDDDIVFMVGPNGYPKPYVVSVDPKCNLIKRENDKLTGNIPFNENVRIFLKFSC